jgi:glycolate oxidase
MDKVEEFGLYYPVDPSSKGSSFIGGNVAHGSGGPRVVKYGTIREYVLNLEVVLPNGDILWTGANTIKFASGYNLTQLMIGSEGTLGIITKVLLKLVPKPLSNLLLRVGFDDLEKACEAVSGIFKAGFTPSALEFMERSGIEWVMEYEKLSLNISDSLKAMLLIELDGSSVESLMLEAEKIAELLYTQGCDEVQVADSSHQKEEWWKMRRKMPESVKANSIYKEEDTVVPRGELAHLIRGIKEIGDKYQFKSVCYGHAGDGNLHINIIKGDLSLDQWDREMPKAIREIFQLTVSLGGTLSGEHGIGWVQKDYMEIRFSSVHLNILKAIKNIFDPKRILNPGKMFS